jgi:hypothetical protein
VEQDPVADDVAVVVRRRELLGAVDREIREAVAAQIGEHLHRVRAFDVLLDHVVRLVVEHRGLLPRKLLVAPVGELARHHRVDVSADLRIAQHGDGVAGGAQHLLQVLHRFLLKQLASAQALYRWLPR